jgi:hypothetical protein
MGILSKVTPRQQVSGMQNLFVDVALFWNR